MFLSLSLSSFVLDLASCGVTLTLIRARGRQHSSLPRFINFRRCRCPPLWLARKSRGTPKQRGAEGSDDRSAEMEAAAGGVEAEGVMRVLVVDDSPVDRRVAQLLLSSDSCAGSFHGQPHLL